MNIDISPTVVTISVAERGLPGFDSRSAFYSTTLPLSALRAVATSPSGGLIYAQPELTSAFVGISTTSGPGQVNVVNNQWLSSPSWNFEVGPIFCGLDGALTQSPNSVYSEIAFALSPTQIYVRQGVFVNG